MATQIKVKGKKVYATILHGSSNFGQLVQLFKSNRLRYDPETKNWEIPISKASNIIESLEDIDTVYISEETQYDIDQLIKPEIAIAKTGITFSESELKFPFLKGKAPFEDFQKVDMERAISYSSFGLFWDMGCGKSYASSSIYKILTDRGLVKKALIVTSSSGVGNLAKEIVKFTDIKPEEITIGNKYNRKPFDDITKKVVICNYRSFLLISDEYQKGIKSGVKKYRKTPIPIEEWLQGEEGFFLLDESHYIANPSSRTSHVIHVASSFFKYRYILTGTPADKEQQYYSQLKFLDPTLVHNMNYTDWCDYYFEVGTKHSSFGIQGIKPERARELTYLVKQYTVFRDANKVLDLPENNIQVIYINFSPKLLAIYQGYVTEKMKFAQQKARGAIPAEQTKNFFQKMITSIDNPEMCTEDNDLPANLMKSIRSFKFLTDHPKVEVLDDLIEKHRGEKIIVWSSHPSVTHALHSKYKDTSLCITGQTPIPKGMDRDPLKEAITNEFKTSETKNILFAGIQVLNTSITIVEATVNIYVDTSFDYKPFSQSMKRIHRNSQTKTCNTYILIIDESLDVTRYCMLQDKDFVTKNFGTEEYINLKLAQNMFNMKGTL